LSQNIIIAQFQKVIDEVSAKHSRDVSDNGSVAAAFSELKQKIGQMKFDNENVEELSEERGRSFQLAMI